MFKATKEQIEAWKKEHKDVFVVTVDDKQAYLKGISRKVLGKVTVFKQDKIKMCEFILSSCWLDGDEEIKTIDSYFLGAMSQIDQIMSIKEAKLEKL